MASYYIDGPSIGKRSVNLTPPIAQGAAGTIHRVIGESGIVVKLYKDPKDLTEYNEKVEAMLGARPNLPSFPYNGRTYVQIAWPLGKVGNGRGDFLGFVMPEVDLQASTELENVLQKAMRARKGIPEFYGARVLLAANLTALMAELHGLGHHMIDMKPLNMRFYPHAWYMAILDTDGFSINGQRRLPARQFSDNYIAPEARGVAAERLGLDQDLFALATIIFQLINNGLHPFQGVDLRANLPTNQQDRIFAGLYAYGLTAHKSVKPAPSSIHEFLEDDTRKLFDRAFLNTRGRPTAIEWRNHLGGLLTNKIIVQCSTSKEHAHFSKGCGLCALAKSSKRPPPTAPPLSGTIQFGPGTIAGLGPGTGAATSTFVDWVKNNKKIVTGGLGALILALWLFKPVSVPQTPSPGPTVPSTLAPQPPTPAPPTPNWTPPTVPSAPAPQPPAWNPSPAPHSPAPSVTASISGVWHGTYQNMGKTVAFTWSFDSYGCRGRGEEQTTFANPSYPKLFANLACAVDSLSPGQTITITKTYDGTAGVSHSVLYTGRVSSDLGKISGQWAIGATRGNFWMSR